jgi:hypothetical protein
MSSTSKLLKLSTETFFFLLFPKKKVFSLVFDELLIAERGLKLVLISEKDKIETAKKKILRI